MQDVIVLKHIVTPVGGLVLGACGGRLCLCDWDVAGRRERVGGRVARGLGVEMREGDCEVIHRAEGELEEYFGGVRRCFGVQLAFVGTEFQQRVWRALLEIDYGRCVSYGELAGRIGCASSVRAVANANGANALSIFVPCHRVVGADGRLTGYAGGLDAKRKLLELERGTLF